MIGIGIGCAVFVNLGTDPGTTFFMGISHSSGLTFGTAVALSNSILFIPLFLLDRKIINIGTFVNMFGVGYIVEAIAHFLSKNLPPLPLPFHFIILFVGILLLCLGAALYLNCSLGQSPWDAIGNIVIIYYPQWKYSNIRMIQDLIGLSLGVLLGAEIGIASIIFALFIGPGIGYFSNQIQKRNLIFTLH